MAAPQYQYCGRGVLAGAAAAGRARPGDCLANSLFLYHPFRSAHLPFTERACFASSVSSSFAHPHLLIALCVCLSSSPPPPSPSSCSLLDHPTLPQDRFSFLIMALPSPGSCASEDESEVTEIDERERLRRERIGLANKGKTPWNKGKPHSPGTIALIRNRIKVVMQDPKIREKLRQQSRPQSEETKEKLRVFMKARMEFERRQLSIVLNWNESIAQAARSGGFGEDELQWDSYSILKERLRQVYFAAKKRQKRPQVVSETEEARRMKISMSIKAKWGDSEFRQKVSTSLRDFQKNRREQNEEKCMEETSDGTSSNQLASATHAHIAGLVQDSSIHKEKCLEESSDGASSNHLASAIHIHNERLVQDSLLNGRLSRLTEHHIRQVKDKDDSQNGRVVRMGDPTLTQHQSSTFLQAQWEATERARLLLAEAERAALVAAQALEAVGSSDESIKYSLLEAQMLLDEANRSITKTEAGILFIK